MENIQLWNHFLKGKLFIHVVYKWLVSLTYSTNCGIHKLWSASPDTSNWLFFPHTSVSTLTNLPECKRGRISWCRAIGIFLLFLYSHLREIMTDSMAYVIPFSVGICIVYHRNSKCKLLYETEHYLIWRPPNSVPVRIIILESRIFFELLQRLLLSLLHSR